MQNGTNDQINAIVLQNAVHRKDLLNFCLHNTKLQFCWMSNFTAAQKMMATLKVKVKTDSLKLMYCQKSA